MITDIEDYFADGCGRCPRFATPDCSARRWSLGLSALRRICLGLNLMEVVKWGHPCYQHSHRNVAILGALREDFRLSFFQASLLQDPDRVLERSGPNTEFPDMIRFTRSEQVAELKPVIEAYLLEAMGYAAQGIRPAKSKVELQLPAELMQAFATDPELAQAFDRLTPGRQKSYVLNLNSAKKPETKRSRIAQFRDKILAGKGALER